MPAGRPVLGYDVGKPPRVLLADHHPLCVDVVGQGVALCKVRKCYVVARVAPAAVRHSPPHVRRAYDAPVAVGQGVYHDVDVRVGALPAHLVAHLHEVVGKVDLHRDERVVVDLYELGVDDAHLVEGHVRYRRVELLCLCDGLGVVDAEQDDLGVEEVVHRRAHGDKERVVAQLCARGQERLYLALYGPGQDGRYDDDDAVLAEPVELGRNAPAGVLEVGVVKVGRGVGQPCSPLVQGIVGGLHRDEHDLGAPQHVG